jgi:hypothetical protein
MMKKCENLLRRIARIDGTAAVGAVLVSGMFVLGLVVVDRRYTASPVYVGLSADCVLLFYFLALAVAAYGIIHLLFNAIDHGIEQGSRNSSVEFTRHSVPYRSLLRSHFWKDCLALFVGWIPVLAVRFPGNIDTDTFNEVLQTYGLSETIDHHPWLDTVIFGAFWRIGQLLGSPQWAIFLYAFLQVVATIAALAAALSYLRFLGAGQKMLIASIIFCACYPIIPMYAQTMAKDMIFGWIWVFFLIGYIEIVRTQGKILRRWSFSVVFVLIALSLVLTKKTGIYIVAVCLIALLFCARHYRKRVIAAAVAIVAVFVVWSSVLLPLWGVKKGEQAEMMSIPAQQTAAYVKAYRGEMTASDWSVLNGVFKDPKTMGKTYSPSNSDASKNRWKNDASASAKSEYIKWWIATGLEHPTSYVMTTAATTLSLYYPDSQTMQDWSGLMYQDRLATDTASNERLAKNLVRWSTGKANRADVDELMTNVFRTNTGTRASIAYDRGYLSVMSAASVVFSKVLVATWIPLFAFLYCVRDRLYRRRRGVLLAFVPILMTWLGILAGPIMLPRYFVTAVYSLPLIVGMLYLRRSDDGGERQTAKDVSGNSLVVDN